MSGPVYTFTPNIPGSSNPMNGTQPIILQNFQAINELVNVDHVGFNTSNAGKHNFARMEFQSSNPGTAMTDLAMYVKATGSPNASEIFYQYPNNGTVNQLTPTTSAGGGGSSSATSGTGWCLFPSGVLFRWGTVSVNLGSGAANNIVFPTGAGIPAYTQQMLYVKCTLLQSTSNNTNFTQLTSTPQGYGTLGFRLFSTSPNPTTVTVNYFSIGV